MGSALRTGAVDVEAADAPGRGALRPRMELLPRSADRTRALSADRVHAASTRRREGLRRRHCTRWRRVRLVRHRQDVDQAEHRQVSRGGDQSQHLLADQSRRAHRR